MNTQELSTTSSIGACWPPQPATQERIRGFFTNSLLDPSNTAGMSEFTDAYDAAREQLASGEASRISLRAVATIGAIRQLEQSGVPVEAAMPFGRPLITRNMHRIPTDAERAAEHHIVYVGENADSRRSEHQWAPPAPANQGLLTDIRQLDWPAGQEPPAQLEYIAGHATEAQLELADQFGRLLEPFGYDESEVQDLLEDPNIHIVYAQTPSGDVVCSAMAEVQALEIEGTGTVNMAEITEAATTPEFRGQGLYRRASGLLLWRLGALSARAEMRQQRGLNVVLGECNLNMPPVLAAAGRHGRYTVHDLVESHYGSDLFGDDVRREQGRQIFGVLEQNFRVNDGTNQTDRYNDFMLTWLSYGGHVGIRYAR